MTAAIPEDDEPSYVDYETFLAPDFRPAAFANTLVLATNNPSDLPLDLSTPLSRVLFDIQEIDSHIDQLTTRSAVPLLTHTADQTAASGRIVAELDGQVRALNDSYHQLEREVIRKHAEADEVRLAATRLWEALRLARAVSRCLQLGRQLEVQHGEITAGPSLSNTTATSSPKKESHGALVRCTETVLALRELLATTGTPSTEGAGLDRVNVIRNLQSNTIEPTERSVRETAERLVREFAIGPTATFAQVEETRARIVSALTALYLLSPPPTAGAGGRRWTPTLMVRALEAYLRSALQSSVAGLARGLAALPGLERALSEVAARCQNVVALEAVLGAAKAPIRPDTPVEQAAGGTLLQPLLAYLETGSLASYFWRTMAGSLGGRVNEIVSRGGVSARTLKTNKAAIGDAIKDCVIRGSQLPNSVAAGKSRPTSSEKGGSWDREVAVMVGSVTGNLGR